MDERAAPNFDFVVDTVPFQLFCVELSANPRFKSEDAADAFLLDFLEFVHKFVWQVVEDAYLVINFGQD